MSVKLFLRLGKAATPQTSLGILASLAMLSLVPQAIAGTTTPDLIASSPAATRAAAQPCKNPAGDRTILSDATASIAALGSDEPLAQASVLIAGLACLAGGSLLLKRHCN